MFNHNDDDGLEVCDDSCTAAVGDSHQFNTIMELRFFIDRSNE